MGTFETFFADAICPYCNKTLMREFQSKRFQCFMDSYKIGDVFDNGETIEAHYKNAAYEWCKSCDKKFYVDVLIKDGRFVGVANPVKAEEIAKKKQ